MPSLTIQIDDAATRTAIADVASPAHQRTILEAVGKEVRAATIEHFRDREREPEKTAGFPKFGQSFGKRGFWAGTSGRSVAESVGEVVAIADGVAVPITSRALEHKADPNPPPITPKGGRKYLAIPANARAAAWQGMPRDFNVSGGLVFTYSLTPSGRWAPALSARANHLRTVMRGKRTGTTSTTGKSTHGQGEVQYWLVRSVQTKHDPRAMPDAAMLTDRANARAASTLDRQPPTT